MLVDALNLATGKNYQWVDQEPISNAEGGEQQRQYPRRLPLRHRPRPARQSRRQCDARRAPQVYRPDRRRRPRRGRPDRLLGRHARRRDQHDRLDQHPPVAARRVQLQRQHRLRHRQSLAVQGRLGRVLAARPGSSGDPAQQRLGAAQRGRAGRLFDDEPDPGRQRQCRHRRRRRLQRLLLLPAADHGHRPYDGGRHGPRRRRPLRQSDADPDRGRALHLHVRRPQPGDRPYHRQRPAGRRRRLRHRPPQHRLQRRTATRSCPTTIRRSPPSISEACPNCWSARPATTRSTASPATTACWAAAAATS